MTVLDPIIQSLGRAGEYNREDQVAPAVILWPDKERQWEPVLAEICGKPLAGGAMDDLVAAYVNGGWCADARRSRSGARSDPFRARICFPQSSDQWASARR